MTERKDALQMLILLQIVNLWVFSRTGLRCWNKSQTAAWSGELQCFDTFLVPLEIVSAEL